MTFCHVRFSELLAIHVPARRVGVRVEHEDEVPHDLGLRGGELPFPLRLVEKHRDRVIAVLIVAPDLRKDFSEEGTKPTFGRSCHASSRRNHRWVPNYPDRDPLAIHHGLSPIKREVQFVSQELRK